MKYFILNGPTASGKTILMEYLLAQDDDYLEPLVSFTTRKRRTGEKDGKDYYFISDDDYLEYCRQNKIIEEISYLEQHYGVNSDELKRVEKTRKNGLAIMNLDGVRKLKYRVGHHNVISIFIYRDLSEIIKSIQNIYNSEEERNNRIELATREILDINTCDHVVYNISSLEKAYQQLTRIIRSEIESRPAAQHEIKAGQKYLDHQGNTIVIISDPVEHTENSSIMIVYRDTASGKLFTMPYEIFCGKKKGPGEIGRSRFSLIES